MTGFKGKFKVKWWAYYVVNTRNWKRPFLLKKHFHTKEQAEFYIDQAFSEEDEMDVIDGIKAIELGVKTFKDPRNGRETPVKPKYDYPDWATSSRDKLRFRLRFRRKFLRNKDMEDLTKEQAFFLINRKPILFRLRCWVYRKWHFPFYYDPDNAKRYMKMGYNITEVTRLVAVGLIITDNDYDIGPIAIWKIVPQLYKHYKRLIDSNIAINNPTDKVRIKKEFIARGFIPTHDRDNSHPYVHLHVSTIHIKPSMYLPIKGWHSVDDDLYPKPNKNVYKLQEKWGISGYTRACVR